MKTSIQFVNHASVLIQSENIGLLTDPWYYGEAFHKGWNLLVELEKKKIESLFLKTTHIWISHEHPDHFSPKFFFDFKQIILKKNIQIIFQKTKDKRVYNFFKNNLFKIIEINFDCFFYISKNFKITVFKDGFYDSALFIETKDKKILNLNDCETNTIAKAKKIKKITNEVDVLLTQFSYAAWKGGKENLNWRKEAAKEKLATIKLQSNIFKPKFLIPFASFVYFSNSRNLYLNDSVNTPKKIINYLKNEQIKVIVLKPWDIFNGIVNPKKLGIATTYWEKELLNYKNRRTNNYEMISIEDLDLEYKKYIKRIYKYNSKYFMFMCYILSPITIFKPINILLDDINLIVKINIFKQSLEITDSEPHLAMSSESLRFIFANTFGFDTLTVNGCFEEKKKNGFIDSTKTIGLENLNNIGISFKPNVIFQLTIIRLFFERILRLKKFLQ